MEPFRIEHADGGVTTIQPRNKEEYSFEREGGKTPCARTQRKPDAILALLGTDELTPFGEWLTRIANPDLPTVFQTAAGFGVALMRAEYENARTIAEDLRAIAHYAELAEKTLGHVTDALNAAEQAESDHAEVTAPPLNRRVVDVLRARGAGTLSEPALFAALDDCHADDLRGTLDALVRARILVSDTTEAPPRYGMAEGWR